MYYSENHTQTKHRITNNSELYYVNECRGVIYAPTRKGRRICPGWKAVTATAVSVSAAASRAVGCHTAVWTT